MQILVAVDVSTVPIPFSTKSSGRDCDSRSSQRVFQVCQQVVNRLQANGQPNEVWLHAGCNLLFLSQLLVRRARRMDDLGSAHRRRSLNA